MTHTASTIILDWFIANPNEFDPRLPHTQAHDRALEWHEQLRAAGAAGRFKMDYGVEYTQEIDYAPFALESELIDNDGVTRYTIHALNSGKLLHEEGSAMHHCVASYTHNVTRGDSRIFSVRNMNGTRVATVEFQKSKQDSGGVPVSKWRLAQVKGPCNSKVPEDLDRLLR